MWLTQLLERNRQSSAGRPALADRRRTLTWAELDDRTALLAARLLARGVRHGDRVGVLSADRAEVIETYFALGRIGALFVPLDSALVPAEVAELAEHAKLAGIVGEAALLRRVRERTGGAGRWEIAFEEESFSAPAGAALGGEQGVRADDPAAIFYTSASGGHPKGVVVDQRSLKDIALGWLAAAPVPEGSVLVSSCPLHHGTVVLSLAFLAAGATLVVPGPGPEGIAEAARRHSATHLWLVPQTLRTLVEHQRRHVSLPASLTEILYGAAPMPADVYAAAAALLPCGFRQVYGLTEAGGPVVTLAPAEHPDPHANPAQAPPAGRVIPGMSVRVAGADGKPAAVGEAGEILLRGDGRMRGYWRDQAATAEATVGDWLRTGDLGYLDGHGRLHLVDRLKDVIIRGGLNVYPIEIERALRRHPAVVDAAVVGVPDPAEGEVPLAIVVPAEGEAVSGPDILEFLAGEIATYKIPKNVQLIAELPRSSTGKVQKRLLTV